MSDRKARLYEIGGRVQTFGKVNTADSAMDSDDQEGVASNAAVGRLIKSGMAEVTQLDAIVNNKYARNPEKLCASAKRQPHRARSEAGEETSTRARHHSAPRAAEVGGTPRTQTHPMCDGFKKRE